MPIYTYKCENCNRTEEYTQKINEDSKTTCSNCSGKLKKIMSNFNFVLIGQCWARDGYTK